MMSKLFKAVQVSEIFPQLRDLTDKVALTQH